MWYEGGGASFGRGLRLSLQYYLLLTAGRVPLLLLALLEPLEPEKSFVMSSDTSGSSGFGFSMFMDCSISCGDGGPKRKAHLDPENH